MRHGRLVDEGERPGGLVARKGDELLVEDVHGQQQAVVRRQLAVSSIPAARVHKLQQFELAVRLDLEHAHLGRGRGKVHEEL